MCFDTWNAADSDFWDAAASLRWGYGIRYQPLRDRPYSIATQGLCFLSSTTK